MDQSLGVLEKLNIASRCDAIHYILQSIRCKYPDECDQVVRIFYPRLAPADTVAYGTTSTKSATKKQLQLLLATKKEEIKTEDEGSTDLNQNFEKILCKEEFTCIDEEDVDADADDNDYADDDPDTENSSSLSKRFGGGGGSSGYQLSVSGHERLKNSRDPLDLIPSSIIDARRLGNLKYQRNYALEELAEEDDDSNSCGLGRSAAALRSLKAVRQRQQQRQQHNNHQSSSQLLSEKLTLQLNAAVRRSSKLGEGYVFHPDNELTIRYHHSTGEFSIRAYKEQFRFRLKAALSNHHKPFLKDFYENFILTGQLLGTTPPAHVLQALREQRREEQLLQQKQREQNHALALAAAAAAATKRKRRFLTTTTTARLIDSELESESEVSQLSATQEIMKFEEIIDEGVGAGRLIDGMEMETEFEDVLSADGGGAKSNGGAIGITGVGVMHDNVTLVSGKTTSGNITNNHAQG